MSTHPGQRKRGRRRPTTAARSTTTRKTSDGKRRSSRPSLPREQPCEQQDQTAGTTSVAAARDVTASTDSCTAEVGCKPPQAIPIPDGHVGRSERAGGPRQEQAPTPLTRVVYDNWKSRIHGQIWRSYDDLAEANAGLKKWLRDNGGARRNPRGGR